MKINIFTRSRTRITVLIVFGLFIHPVIAEEITPSTSVELEGVSAYSIARGGRLYDKWFKENKAGTPKIPNPAYPEKSQYKGKKGADWRCKECHGWDYKGKDGLYRTGKHFTGVAGIANASTLSQQKIIKILRDKTHAYTDSVLSKEDVQDLANFVKYGQIDISKQVDTQSKQVSGDAKQGQKHYETICAVCHGLDGKGEDTSPLGKLANDNPWEVLHKISNGQPNNEMPALRTLGKEVSLDLIHYMQKKLPRE